MLILLPLLSLFCNSLIAGVDANLSLGFKVIRLPRHANPANCSVGNTTFAHGATFKLDCKTQCVCENGRHACSSLCPNEQLPAPEDTISCRSPRLVEVPGHCCKMWLCENPTADVYATCHNSSSGNWTSCSRSCGLGIATRHTAIHAGCHQLSNLRLCENRRCAGDNNNNNNNNKNRAHSHELAASQLQQLPQHHHRREPTHRIRKGHECRSQQRLGPARVRLGECVSRKLYRPKLCGRCHHGSMCCTPAVSTTIQVEMLCPLNAVDPINYVQKRTQLKRQQQQQQQPAQLWDTLGLEPIDQEFLQSHQIQIENKFIAVEWILKCECSQHVSTQKLRNKYKFVQ
ncbi:Ccn [Drosophila busckii]|uniref:Ccn n=1 Tax=Drosophila busckii TaxID=30019 RepID=A0A0M5J0J2_DROBS|nr:Ccn [Drosophila busckii]